VEFAEGAADLGALFLDIGTARLQMKGGSEFVANIAVGKTSEVMFAIQDGLK
jgi:hypothetical protein